MLVALVSRCPTLSSTVAKCIMENFPSLRVKQYENLQDLLKSKGNVYALIYIKLQDIDITQHLAMELTQTFSSAVFMALQINDTKKANYFGYPLFKHSVSEPQLLFKVEMSVQRFLPDVIKDLNPNSSITLLERIYAELKPEQQSCLFLISEKHTAAAIGEKLGKSKRTIEGMIAGLKEKFMVKNRLELQKLYKAISQKNNPDPK